MESVEKAATSEIRELRDQSKRLTALSRRISAPLDTLTNAAERLCRQNRELEKTERGVRNLAAALEAAAARATAGR